MAEVGKRPLIVAIDGPSGVGKTTVARRLAERLGVPVLDTGATYRAVALAVLSAGVDPDARDAVLRIAAAAEIDLVRRSDGGIEVVLDGRPVGERIRTPEVSAATSKIAVHPQVRRRLVALQRRAAERYGGVVEGRDIGTVVFPEALHKFFLDARPGVRAERRRGDLAAVGKAMHLEEVRRDIEERDARDTTRRASPLAYDESYCVLDTSDASPDEIVARMVESIAASARV